MPLPPILATEELVDPAAGAETVAVPDFDQVQVYKLVLSVPICPHNLKKGRSALVLSAVVLLQSPPEPPSIIELPVNAGVPV